MRLSARRLSDTDAGRTNPRARQRLLRAIRFANWVRGVTGTTLHAQSYARRFFSCPPGAFTNFTNNTHKQKSCKREVAPPIPDLLLGYAFRMKYLTKKSGARGALIRGADCFYAQINPRRRLN